MAKLYFRYGAMNSGKSTALMQVAHNYEEQGMRVPPLPERRRKGPGQGVRPRRRYLHRCRSGQLQRDLQPVRLREPPLSRRPFRKPEAPHPGRGRQGTGEYAEDRRPLFCGD